MTQPVSPEGALKVRRIVGYRNPAPHAAQAMGATDFSQWTPIYSDEARTPPPSVLDEVVARLEAACCRAEYEYPLLAAPDGTVAVQFADLRTLLTRLKDRGTD